MNFSITGLDINEFLSKHWQQQPLLMPQAFDLPEIIDADTLAGLATEPEVESRLIKTNKSLTEWSVEHGPFNEDSFSDLPESHWTLLVQAVDHWIPEVRDLLRAFYFLPQWRIDDIMISFAPPGGGVGPHFDQYDVFLIQLSGKREWRIGQACDQTTQTVPNVPVLLLSDFEEKDRWVLAPGDALYVPPGVAHWGTAVDDSITISVGFRAPSSSEALADFGHFLSSKLSDFDRYTDLAIDHRLNSPHEIKTDDVDRLKQLLARVVNDDNLLSQWFGQYMTEAKYAEPAPSERYFSFDEFKQHWSNKPLIRNPSKRLAFSVGHLFADGVAYTTSLSFSSLEKLCQLDEIEPKDLESELSEATKLLFTLTNLGVYFFED